MYSCGAHDGLQVKVGGGVLSGGARAAAVRADVLRLPRQPGQDLHRQGVPGEPQGVASFSQPHH